MFNALRAGFGADFDAIHMRQQRTENRNLVELNGGA